MSCLTILLSPLNLLFFIVVAGLAIGRIRIKGISVGIAGILFTAIFVGFLMNNLIPNESCEIITNAQSTLKVFSKFGTALFVSVIGFQTGFSIKNHSKNSVFAFVIGSFMSLSGVAVMFLISLFDKSISYASLFGILCGALTSTPGLSSVCEWIGNGSENAVMGYGCSYLFGVILVVFFAQLFTRKCIDNSKSVSQEQEIKSKIYPELILTCLTALLGNILGSIRISTLSLGTTACTLMVGLIVGYGFIKISKKSFISNQCLNAFRNLGLALFFVGTGFSTGSQDIAFDIHFILYGILITLTAIICGWGLCKLVTKKYSLHQGFIIAGGMTSSPAYGALSGFTTEASVNCFSFSYFGALVTLIIAIQIIISSICKS